MMKTAQEIKTKLRIFRPTSQEVNLFDPHLNDRATRLIKFKDNQDNTFKIWVFTDTFRLETPLSTSLLFSINFPDKICLADKTLENGVGIVFTDKSNDEQVQSCFELLNDNLKSLQLENNEGMAVYRNSLQLILRHGRQILPEIEVCKKIKLLIELNFPGKDNKTDYSDLPTDLRQILIKYQHLAVSDDFERGELIEELSTRQRNDFVKAIELKLEAINLLLDTLGDKQWTEGAAGLHSLVQLTFELTNDEKKDQI